MHFLLKNMHLSSISCSHLFHAAPSLAWYLDMVYEFQVPLGKDVGVYLLG